MSIITPEQILTHRKNRKDAGMIGCITGKPIPPLNFFGFKDVQIWNMDAQGRINGDPDFDRRDPHCFCFDCRGAFDGKGIIDAELVNEGHERACHVYESLLIPIEEPAPLRLPSPTSSNIPTSLPPPIPSRFTNVPDDDKEEHLIHTLQHFQGYLQSQFVLTMDRRRAAHMMQLPDATIAVLNQDEIRLQRINDAAKELLRFLQIGR